MPTARTRMGSFAGRAVGEAEAYLGIPFGRIPGRFRTAEPLDASTARLDAHEPGPACPQPPGEPIAGVDEQHCLNLNVWTPAADGRGRPVLFWIHGGSYVAGSNADPLTDGALLAATHDVVVVGVNYRLGVLGFLDLAHLLGDDYATSGDLAVEDVILALEWVRDNIGRFGGDPELVTVAGQSAGGALTSALLATRAAGHLFRRAVVQSGSAERVHDRATAVAVTAAFLEAAGLAERDAEALLDADVAALLSAQTAVVRLAAERSVGPGVPFRPTVDGTTLARVPSVALSEGAAADVDLLVGSNLDEARPFAIPWREPHVARALLRRAVARDHGDAAVDRIIGEYTAALADAMPEPRAPVDVLEHYVTDRSYRQPENRMLAAHRGRSFAYLLHWPSPAWDPPGSGHGVELPFVFGNTRSRRARDLVGTNPPEALGTAMRHAWASFARTGAPAAPGLPEWPAYGTARRTMLLGTRPVVADDPLRALREFAGRHVPRVDPGSI